MFQNRIDSSVTLFLGWELLNVKIEPNGIVPTSKRSNPVARIGKPGFYLRTFRESLLILPMID